MKWLPSKTRESTNLCCSKLRYRSSTEKNTRKTLFVLFKTLQTKQKIYKTFEMYKVPKGKLFYKYTILYIQVCIFLTNKEKWFKMFPVSLLSFFKIVWSDKTIMKISGMAIRQKRSSDSGFFSGFLASQIRIPRISDSNSNFFLNINIWILR